MRQECGVRARHVQAVLKGIGKLPEEARSRVRTLLGPDVERVLEGSTGLEWLPVRLDAAVTRAAYTGLGPVEFECFYRSLFAEVFRQPVYRGFAKATRAVFGSDPAGWMRWLPEMWNVTFRGCGTWTVTPAGPGRLELLLSSLPRELLLDGAWSGAVAAALSAMFDIAGVEGKVEAMGIDAERGDARFRMRWPA